MRPPAVLQEGLLCHALPLQPPQTLSLAAWVSIWGWWSGGVRLIKACSAGCSRLSEWPFPGTFMFSKLTPCKTQAWNAKDGISDASGHDFMAEGLFPWLFWHMPRQVKQSLDLSVFFSYWLDWFIEWCIYFWLDWVFDAVHWLSLVAECRGYSQVAAGGLLIAVAFPVVEHWLWYPTACGILPRPRIEHVSPALGGGFFFFSFLFFHLLLLVGG